MKKLNKLFATINTILLAAVSLFSCNQNIEEFENKYVVIWQDENGKILELDRDVKEGTLPTFDSETPTKESEEEQYYYVFDKWVPEVSECYSNAQYTASYLKFEKTFTVTWQDEDGTILEIDKDVKYGSLPEFNSELPHKENEGELSYIFYGWSPILGPIKEDTIFKATYFVKDGKTKIPGMDPVLKSDDSTVEYGFYPQDVVSDSTLITKLNTLSPNKQINNWYVLDGSYYTKITASTYFGESFNFNDGTAINNGDSYWFNCKPIKWRIREINNGTYTLLADSLLDTAIYYNDLRDRDYNGRKIYPNDYQCSDVRKFLNNEFYNTAFTLNNSYITKYSYLNGSGIVTLEDNVYLLTKEDYLNASYGFETDPTKESLTRYAKVTDYARCLGAYVNSRNVKDITIKNNGIYLTRTESDEFNYANICVNSIGYLSTYSVVSSGHCIRPAIKVNYISAE